MTSIMASSWIRAMLPKGMSCFSVYSGGGKSQVMKEAWKSQAGLAPDSPETDADSSAGAWQDMGRIKLPPARAAPNCP